ncbi:exodeoxyribonuclease V subunit beta [Hydrocarboniphaga sp.]|uniref:exodeoxyribonuclease V subunit beta n=1 Tax=Hydrocarboniphaga sp. TaxID=2033016 RepID=UPI003D12C5C7
MSAPVALTAPLQGLRLIEASAGTGKTWTLSGLYLRLVIERGLASDGILTVTFTKAATAELRDRIRARLQQMLDLLEGRGDGDDFCRALQAQLPDAALARRRLVTALRGVDEAAIYTIHGFCQRVLSDRAFSSGVSFDSEIVPDIGELRREIVLDFWRRRIAPAHAERALGERLFLGWLDSRDVSVDSLSRWAASLASKPRLNILPIDEVADLQQAAQAFFGLREQAATVLRDERQAIVELLAKHPALKRASYKAGDVAKRLDALEEYFATELEIVLPKKAESFLRAGLIERCSGDPPTHAFFDTLEALRAGGDALLEVFARTWRGLRLELLAWLRSELPLRMQARGEQSYDDLLSRLQQALSGSDGELLAAELRQRYPAAMIDEFQDTDPLQWDIVRRIWAVGIGAGEPLCAFLVGDPKQAIYSFRGADIYAYLAAQAACSERHDLVENQRSVAPYVEALNCLYGRVADPFRHASIRYQPVVASPRRKPALIENGVAEDAPLRLLAMSSPGVPLAKGKGETWAAATTAAEIARLLRGAALGEITYDGRPLRAGDIAVLVRGHYQARRLRRELARLGVGSAEQASDNVFASDEAEELERLLAAVAAPHRSGGLKAALLGRFLGWSLPKVLELEQQEGAWDQLLAEFDHYRLLWRDRGFMRMLRELLRRRDVIARLAAHSDGERRLTNLFHLAELLQNQQHRLHGADAQLRWLGQSRRDAAESRAEESQLRLESDAALVQLLTVHASKGLEYPVVFLPFQWSGKDRFAGSDLIAHHDPEPPHELRVAGDPIDPQAVIQAANDESQAEDLRLAYVALTRAKNRCYLFTGDFTGLALSAVGTLLNGGGEPLMEALASLQAASQGTIRVENAVEPQAVAAAADTGLKLAARELRRPLPPGLSVTSYTALSRQIDESAAEALPDHDQHIESLPSAPLVPGGGRFAFPRGAAPGTCLHAVLENIDASAPSASWTPAIETQLRANGQPAEWAPQLGEWFAEVVATPLQCPASGEILSLAAVDPKRSLIELAFHLPLRGLDPSRISGIAAQHSLVVTPLAAQRVEGYLRGFVDLVFEHRGRWYVADYKSNWLGGRIEDYDAAALASGMDEGDYHLQYMLYVVALHRWLKWRVAGYDYQRHFGGVFYLFLRGMDAQGRGVYATRPSLELIEAIDGLIAGNTAVAA